MKKEIKQLVDVSFEQGKTPLTISDDDTMFTINYGNIKKGTDSSFFIVIEEKEGSNITRLKPKSSCGCTVLKPLKTGNVSKVKVTYDTKRMGVFRKSISVNLLVGTEIKTIFFRITGKVIN